MKYTIFGFSQSKAVEFGLDLIDLQLLRWFVDFRQTDRMYSKILDDKEYYWINYQAVIEDLPILCIASKDALYRRFKKLVNCGVLQHRHCKQQGSFSYYTIGANYCVLLSDQKPNPTDQKSDPYGSKVGPPTDQKSEQIDPSTKKTNLQKDPSLKRKKGGNEYTDLFEEFWEGYGRTGKKPEAFRAFQVALSKAEPKTIAGGIKAYLQSRSVQEGYKQHFSTWLNGEGWESCYEEAKETDEQKYKRELKISNLKAKYNYDTNPEYDGMTFKQWLEAKGEVL